MQEKTCFKCKLTKPITEFYQHKAMGDGYLNKCKECTKSYAKERRVWNGEYIRAYDRSRANNPDRVQKRKEISEAWKSDPILKERRNYLSSLWRERNKEKREAHILVNNKIRDGVITRRPCEVCGESKTEAHHSNYTYPLVVTWLCRKHHTEEHKIANEERRKNHGKRNLHRDNANSRPAPQTAH